MKIHNRLYHYVPTDDVSLIYMYCYLFQLYGDVVFENVAKVRELQVNCIRDFDETASDIFDDILGKEIYIRQCFALSSV